MAELKQLARQIFRETLAAIDIPEAVRSRVTRSGTVLRCHDAALNLRSFDKIRVVAIGKAAQAMMRGLAPVLSGVGGFEGIVSAPEPPQRAIAGMKYFQGGHPVPTQESWNAATSILALLRECDSRTLVFFLLSGGGSAMVEMPLEAQQTLEDVQELHRALVTCGAPIDAINTVRKHFSAVKGGRLAVAAGRATKITLAVSDVPAGKESALASGPTLPDPTTVRDAEEVIRKYGVAARMPARLREWIAAGKMPETPKKEDAAFANAHCFLLLGMHELFHAAHKKAEAAGCIACCDNTTDDWPVEKAAKELLRQLDELRARHPGQRVAVIADGEVSSPVTGKGVGGRNAAFALACVEKIAGKRIAVLSAGTDGIDGNSPAAGAVADGETLERAKALGLDPEKMLRASDAHTFFSRLEDAIVTGPTGNNLRDLRVLIAEG